jgi:hypothetical protein
MNTSGGAMPRRVPGTDNRVLRVCRLLNRRRVRYLSLPDLIASKQTGRATDEADLEVLTNKAK